MVYNKRGLCYTASAGDGESKGFCSVTKVATYGPDVDIEKENGIGQVQKHIWVKGCEVCFESIKGRNLLMGKI